MKPLIALIVIGAVIWFAMRPGGLGFRLIEDYITPKPVILQATPEVLAQLVEPLKKAESSGKIAVLRFNLADCAVCERMSREVFVQPEWGKYAERRLAITEYLMPTSFTSEQTDVVLRMQLLDTIAKATEADQGFPFIAVLGKDGSVLGARSGYYRGGADAYIRWVEKVSRADAHIPPPPAVPQVTGTKVEIITNAPVSKVASATSATATNGPVEIVVKGISGTGSNRVVLLGVGKRNVPLFAGEKKRLSMDNESVVVEYREIGEHEVVVQVEGEKAERRLALKLN